VAPSSSPEDGREEDPLPLAGIRVLEFGYGVAAPVCCRNLAEFGADVIRIESARRPDSLRTVGAGWVPLETDWGVLRDTGPALNFTCPGKRSLGLEIDTPEGRAIFDRLLARSDVLVMNMGVEAVDRLGLGYERVRSLKPDLIWMNMPSFGAAEGPYRGYRTWGRNIAAVAGLSRLVGWPDRDPVGMLVNFPDYISALWGTVAVVSSLLHRDLTGAGGEIDVAQYEAAISCISPVVVEAVLGGSGLAGMGNRSPQGAPHGVYPARGTDAWVALSVTDETAWKGLCRLAGLAGLADDPRFDTPSGRLSHQDDLDDVIADWTGRRTPWEAATELQAVGVASSAVSDNWDALGDEQLQSRGFFRVLPRARFDRDFSYGQAMVLSGTPARFERSAPAFGEDTREVLRDLVGLDDQAIQGALDRGVAHAMEHPDVLLERPYLHWIDHLLPLDWPPATIDPAQIVYERLSGRGAQAEDPVGPSEGL
jgi:crotonobetainyl-CoA:carnitine CoA-transferase CaiB-like acyl-CoA transferase